MSYDSKSYRGTLEGIQPPSSELDVLVSTITTESFVDIIESLRPESAAGLVNFSRELQHHHQPIVVKLHPDADKYRPYGVDRPLGLAAAHNITSRKQFLWKKGLAPGIYTVSKTVFAEQTAGQADLQAKVQENICSYVTLGRAVETMSTRPAYEAEVVDAIDTIFLAAIRATTVYTPLDSPDNPMVLPPASR